MTIEKPISTIRKAIKGSAEQLASDEFYEKPEDRHYKEIFEFYRNLKIEQPEVYVKMIMHSAKGKELSEELGKGLYNTLTNVLKEISARDMDVMKTAIKQIESRKLSFEETEKEFLNLKIRYLNSLGQELMNDFRLKEAFSGKEKLLGKVIDFLKVAMSEISEASNKYPSIEIV